MPAKWNPDATAAHKTLVLFTQLLFSGRKHWLTDLTRQHCCTKPTIMRLIQNIELAGAAEIASGLEKGKRWYQIKYLPSTPHIGLTNKEVEKLALCRDLLERLLPEGMEQTISESIAKISTLMPHNENRAEATSSKATRIVHGYIDYTPFQGYINDLLRDAASGVVYSIAYQTPAKKPRLFKLLPMQLSVERDMLNLTAWQLDDSANRKRPITLAIHRMLSCEATPERIADVPPLPEQDGAFGLVGMKSFRVRARFKNGDAMRVRERVWSRDQRISELPDGSLEIVFSASSKHEVIAWILDYGTNAELLEPLELRERLYNMVRDICGIYAGNS